MSSTPKIFIFQQRNWAAYIGLGIAAKLHEKGYRLSTLTLKRSTDRLVRNQDQVTYEQIISFDEYLNDPVAVEDVGSISLDDVCDDLGIQSIWPLVQAERDYVRTYGERYPYAFRQNRNDREMVALIKATYLMFKRHLDDFKPDLIVTPNFASAQHIIAHKLAAARNIPMFAIAGSRIQGINIWAHDPTYSTGPFVDRVEQLSGGAGQSENLDEAKRYISEFRQEFKRPIEESWSTGLPSLKGQIREVTKLLRNVVRFYKNPRINVNPKHGSTIDNISPRLMLRNYLSHRKNRVNAVQFEYSTLGELDNFAYLPLQVQPEAVTDVMAPYFNNQLEFARLVAQSMPGDMKLVVKDHPAMFGFRSRKFLEKLARTPNVTLVDFREPSESIMRKAKMIVSIGGTSTIEAAFFSLPVILFGNLGLAQLMPNTFTHSDMPSLSNKITEVLNMNFDNESYERSLEHYVAAAIDTGFRAEFTTAAPESRAGEIAKLVGAHVAEVDRILSAKNGSKS
jgi:hypothetical protein